MCECHPWDHRMMTVGAWMSPSGELSRRETPSLATKRDKFVISPLALLCLLLCCCMIMKAHSVLTEIMKYCSFSQHDRDDESSFFILRLAALVERLLFNGHMLNNGEALCVSKHTHIHLGEVHHTKDPGRHKYIVFKFKPSFKFNIICSPYSIVQLYFVLHSKWTVNHALYSITEKLAKASVL